jgi:predicted porin
MKKSLISLAVAGIVAAPAAFAATGNVDVYGQVRLSIDSISSDAANSDKMQVSSQTSRIGVKGSEDLGGGLAAIWGLEWGVAIDGSAGFSNRNQFVGLKGDFGTVLGGNHDTPYKLGGSADVFADTAADATINTSGIIGRNGFDNRAANALAYISPDWSGFHFAVAGVAGEETAAGGATATANGYANGLTDAVSLVGVYVNGPLKITAGYESFSKKLNTTAVATSHDKAAMKLNVGYKVGDLGLGLTYETSDASYTSNKEDTGLLASVTYGMGPITLAAQYGKFDDKDTSVATDLDVTRITVGAIYALSKRTNAYAANDSDENGTVNTDWNAITVGLNHSF